MAGNNRVGGIVELKIDGAIYSAKGNFTYNIGRPKRDPVVGSDTVHGFKETPQVAFIEGEITDNDGLDLATLLDATDVVVTLQLGSGKVIVLNHAWFAGEGTGNTEEGNIGVRFEADYAQEIS